MLFLVSFVAALFALLFAGGLSAYILRKKVDSQKMLDIAAAIRNGANAYLYRQYKTLAPIVAVIAAVLYFAVNPITAVTFVAGALLSALAGYIGMNISVRANVRTTVAAKKGLSEALNVAFRGGTVTGMVVVGLGLLGVAALYNYTGDVASLIGLGFGASLISLFMRVGGGIYTKAADVGADLVGKVEKNIPEDDPRNPGVIADNVGDNVGDCAGMAADLFESYVVTMIAAMLLGTIFGQSGLLFPLVIGALGIFGSIAGAFFVRLGKDKNIWSALNRGIIITAAISAVLFYFVSQSLFSNSLPVFFSALVGLVVTVAIGQITEYYTGRGTKPVREVAEAAKTGAGTNIISGLAFGLQSTAPTVVLIAGAILASYYFAGVYGIAIAALAMLSVTGMIVAVDAYGPITDNAGGIAEMSGQPEKVRNITDALDAVGNTTKAVTKGFAIGAAALAALSLFAAYAEASGLQVINLLDQRVVVGLFIGGALPFLFSSFTMRAVGRSAFSVVNEVRRQWKNKGIMSGKVMPDYARVVDITTRSALRELIAPGVLAVVAPIAIGFLLGSQALAGLLAGAIVTGFLMAVFLANAGAAWDNAKKFIEAGNFGGKGSEAHKAAVVGDTVGDPAKDTAGPSLNPLIKVLNMIALLFAALIVTYGLG
ncbi:sodium-translocating pyrophosphatase [archaeon]|nr:MAG: sodium-translocating pyrophosphatase [archaeon]